MSKMFRPVTLAGLSDGALQEVFDRELQAVLSNIQDPNTSDKVARKISLEVEFKPDESRAIATVTLKATSKLAPVREVNSVVYLETQNGQVKALEKVDDKGVPQLHVKGGY